MLAGGYAVDAEAGVMGFILRRLRKRRQKRTFAEYGFEVRTFHLPRYGAVQYAQWLHPGEGEKTITEGMLDSLRRFINEGDLVIDVGAHTGDTTVPMAIAAGASGCTLALEPNPYVFRVLEANARLNPGLTKIVPLNFAATEEDGEFTFDYSDASYCDGGYLSQIRNRKHGHGYPLRVEGRNLEKLLREEYASLLGRLSYVKIDTEGYDRIVIRSISSILRECRPVVVTEVYKRLVEEERRLLFEALEEAEYTCFRHLGGDCPQGERVGREDMMKWRTFDILAIPRERG